jgi:hypothetical protein
MSDTLQFVPEDLSAMVARIKNNKSIRATLSYNETKVQHGKAACLYAGNYLSVADQLSVSDKAQCLQHRAALNEAVGSNCVHISLNFHRDDKLDDDKLVNIAKQYMEGIGFADQPYLVYRHNDAAHPHIHIVSTNIEATGRRIDMHNIGRNKSEPVRKQVEKDFRLVIAGTTKKQMDTAPALQVQYGEDPTAEAINKVLQTVLHKYYFTSLAELNAVLQLYNLRADSGSESSRLQTRNGLVYKVIKEGKAAGIGIRASDLQGRPTKKMIEALCKTNEYKRASLFKATRDKIDMAVVKSKHLEGFRHILSKQQIHLVERYAVNGMLYGLTYIDHKTGAVFNGSDLGKIYSAKAISEKLSISHNHPRSIQLRTEHRHQSATISSTDQHEPFPQKQTVLDALVEPVQTNAFLPWQLKRKKRKRKK